MREPRIDFNNSQLLTTVNEWTLINMMIDCAKYLNDHGIGVRCDRSISSMEIAKATGRQAQFDRYSGLQETFYGKGGTRKHG